MAQSLFTGLQVNRSNVQSCTWGMIHTKIHLISPDCPCPSIALRYRIVAVNTIYSSIHRCIESLDIVIHTYYPSQIPEKVLLYCIPEKGLNCTYKKVLLNYRPEKGLQYESTQSQKRFYCTVSQKKVYCTIAQKRVYSKSLLYPILEKGLLHHVSLHMLFIQI